MMFWDLCMPKFFTIAWYIQNIESNWLLFDSNVFQSFLYDEKANSFQLYWLIKDLIFDILSGWFVMWLWFNATVKAYWKHLSSFLLFSGFSYRQKMGPLCTLPNNFETLHGGTYRFKLSNNKETQDGYAPWSNLQTRLWWRHKPC